MKGIDTLHAHSLRTGVLASRNGVSPMKGIDTDNSMFFYCIPQTVEME